MTSNCLSQNLNISEHTLTPGEEVTYKVYYNWKFVWVPAGEVTFTIKEKENDYCIEVYGTSYPSYDSFFKVRDYYRSLINKADMIPYDFCRHIEEGSYMRFDSMRFNSKEKVLYEYFGHSKETAEEFKFELEDNVLDMVSAIYFLRSLSFNELDEGTDIPFKIFFDKELLDLKIHFEGMDYRKLKGMGKVNAWHMQADLIGGNIFDKGEVMDIWVSTDGNNIPLQVESPIRYGSVKAVLKSVKGSKFKLQYPLNGN